MSRVIRWPFAGLLALLAAAAIFACSDDESGQASGDQLSVVTSTQVIADWVREVGGDAVSVRALVPAGADAHTLELTVDDIRAISDADLVIINGASLEAAYEDVILENASNVLNLAEAIEEAGHELLPFSGHEDHDDHDQSHDGDDDHGQSHDDGDDDHAHDDDADHDQSHDGDDDHDEHASEAIGRLIIADALEAHISVLDLTTEEVDSGAFSVAAPNATVYPSPTHRYGIVLARGPEDEDDRVHFFDGGVFQVLHDDHYDTVTQPVSRHAMVIEHERPIHFVNSYGWSAIFADAGGFAFLVNEHDLIEARGDYRPVVLITGEQHGAALAITEDHVIVTTANPDYPDNADSSLPLGVEVRDLNGNVVYDASSRSCPGMHGEAHNDHGAAFGCTGGVLFLHAHDGEYEHEFIDNPAEMREESRIGTVYGHHHIEHFFGSASYFDGQGFASDGIWLIDVAHGEMRRVFDEPSAGVVFSDDGETLYVLGEDGVLHALDSHDGDLQGTMQLVAPGENGDPRMIVVGETMYVTDPDGGRVLAVHLEDMEIEEEWHVGGAPASLAFVGLAPEHDSDEAHDDHDHDQSAMDEDEHDHEEESGDDHAGHVHGDEDPHFWFDADLASAAATAIAAELSARHPSASDDIDEDLNRYLGEIADADAEARELLSGLTDSQRLLVTFHDAFGYFARRYGLTVAGFVVEGPEQGISAGALSELIELIEHEGVTTIFHEPQFDSAILDTVADETGASRGTIWSQPTDDQPTYIDILVESARSIAEQ